MPRQVDLFSQNLKVKNNPNNQLAMSAGQVTNFLNDLPAQIQAAQAEAITKFLQLLDQETGLDLLGLWNDFQNFDTETSNWLTSLLQLIFGTSTSPSILGQIFAPTVVNAAQYAQPVSNFPNAASIQAGGGWSWDGTTSFGTSTGSLLFTCSGGLGAIRGVVAKVQPGQFVALAAELQWSGLTVSGSNQIQLQLVPWTAVQNQDGTTTPGVAGTPVVIAQMTPFGASGGWSPLTGSYTVPSSGGGFVQMRLVVTAGATAGSIWWADCTESISGGYLATLESDLATLQNEATEAAAAFTTLLQSIQSAITNYTTWPTFAAALQSAWTTYVTTTSEIQADELFTIQQLLNTLFGINANGQTALSSIEGVSGAQDLGTTFTNLVNQLGAALGGNLANAGGFAWLAQLMNSLGVSSTSPIAPLVSSAQTSAQILAIQNNRPASAGLEATVESNGPFQSAASLPGQVVAKTTSRGTCFTITQAKTLGFVQWLGNYTVSPVGFVINFYKMDGSGNLTLLSTSSDLSATVSSGVAWYLWDLATPIVCAAGDVIGVEFQIKTSGSINAYGYTAPVAASHPTAAIKQLGFSQNWAGATASTISSGSIGWSQYAPYVGLGVGNPPPTPFFPQSNTFTANGTYTIQSWDVYVDVIAVADGGGGEGETGLGNGPGGCGGSWATRTLTVGASGANGIAAGASITITIGGGGVGGAYFTPGNPGAGTTLSWHDSLGAVQTLTAAGGLAGNAANNLTSWGLSPGNQTFQNQIYIGGSTNVIGGQGNAPGGGGSGGAAFQFGFNGAQGQAWIVDRQS